MSVNQVVSNIQKRVRDDGFLWTSRNGNLHKSLDDLKQLPPAQRGEALSKLSDADLKELAGDVNATGIFGASGLSHDEKTRSV